MRYLSLFKPATFTGGPPDPDHMAKMGALVETMLAEGTLITTGAFVGGPQAIAVTQKDGQVTVGPGEGEAAPPVGFALIEAQSEEHLIELTKRFLSVAGDGVSTNHPIFGPPE